MDRLSSSTLLKPSQPSVPIAQNILFVCRAEFKPPLVGQSFPNSLALESYSHTKKNTRWCKIITQPNAQYAPIVGTNSTLARLLLLSFCRLLILSFLLSTHSSLSACTKGIEGVSCDHLPASATIFSLSIVSSRV